MKKFILTLSAIAFIAFNSLATIHIVDNNPGAPGGVYSTVQPAMDTAIAGDTIYLKGSPNSYGSIYVSKELHFIGSGTNPNKQFAQRTNVAAFYVNITGVSDSSNASGSSFTGIRFSSLNLYSQGLSSPTSDILIERCWGQIVFGTSESFNNIIIRNNFTVDLRGNNNLISNCLIINNSIYGFIMNLRVGSTVLSSNNNFTTVNIGFQPKYVTFYNNIFYGVNHLTTAHNCAYSNNLSFGASNNTIVITGSNSGSGNIIQDPLFVNAPTLPVNINYDYHVTAGSPVINGGSDSTDIGMYGGSSPMPIGGASGSGFMNQQEANIPQVNQMNVRTLVVPLNMPLRVNVIGVTNE